MDLQPVLDRRSLFASAAGLAALPLIQQEKGAPRTRRRPRFGVSTYSFWQFNGPKQDCSIESCIDRAAEMGFDGIELLLVQMTGEDNAYLQSLKQRAFVNGLDLMGFSTHQGFVAPDPAVRQANVDKTLHQLELAYKLGIPTLRLNTGRWGTIKSFDELMAKRGIEPVLDGYTEDQGFEWVIACVEKLIPAAAERGVTIGLENHWGLGRTAAGVERIVKAIDSPWLQVTLDTGNFLEEPYDQLEALAERAVLVQAKTYYGGGKWYTLELDYPRIARILHGANFNGYVSLEFEGKAPVDESVVRSLEMLREAFAVI